MGKWFAIPLWQRVMMGLVAGAVIGLALRYTIGPETASELTTTWFKPIGDAFVNLIRMLVVPLIFTTLVAGVTAMGDPARLGSLGGAALGMYMITTWFAVTIGLIIGTIIAPGVGFDLSNIPAGELATAEARLEGGEAASLTDRLIGIIPTNPVEAMANGEVLQIIFFAIFVGVGCLMAKEAGRPLAQAIESAADVMMKITHIVMEVAPVGVLALMAWVMATQGFGVFTVLGKMVAALYIACLIHMALVYGGIIKVILGLPLIRFFRGIADAQAVAFSTSSSSATLPVTMKTCEERFGVGPGEACCYEVLLRNGAVDGQPLRSCMTTVGSVAGGEITQGRTVRIDRVSVRLEPRVPEGQVALDGVGTLLRVTVTARRRGRRCRRCRSDRPVRRRRC